MVKILVVGLSGKIGGIETLFYGLFGEKNIHFDLSFLYFEDTGAFEREFEENGYHIFHMESRKSNPLIFDKSVANFFKENSDFDYVWVNTSSTSMYQFQVYAKKYTSAKVITHSHGTTFDSTSGKLYFLLNKILGLLNYQKVIANTDLFFCCSKAAGIALFGEKNKDKLILIKNGVAESKFSFSEVKRDTFRSNIGAPKDRTVIAFAGRLSKQKNPIRALEIFNDYQLNNPNSLLVIAGEGNLLDRVKEKISELSLKNKVLLLGFYKQIDELYCGSDLLIMPSLFEGLPLGGVEAQMTGLPCVFSTSITEELAITEIAEFADLNEDNSVWVDKMNSILEAPNNREKYCKQVVQAGYSYNSTLNQLEKLLI